MSYRYATRYPLAALAALALAGLANPAAAQEREEQEGEESECVCVRAPRMSFRMPRGASAYFGHRGRLGISVTTSQEDTEYRGARVLDVTEDGPADKAGIREGDVITSLDGQSLFEPLDDQDREADLDLDASVPVQRLLAIARELEPGETVDVTYLRDGAETTVQLTAEDISPGFAWIGGEGSRAFHFEPGEFHWDGGDFDADELRTRIETMVVPSLRGARAPMVALRGFGRTGGISLAPMNPALGEYFDAESGALGLDVDEDSELGLLPGDGVLSVDGREVRDADHARRILRSYDDGESVTLRIVRQGREMTVEGMME